MNCRSCGGELEELWSIGDQYLSDFRIDLSKPPKYPLDVVRCGGCTLVQLSETVPRDLLYHDRYGFKSGVSGSIRADLADVVQTAYSVSTVSIKRWLDIASNDGTLLSLLPKNIYRVGVDPVKPLCEEAKEHADLIVNDFFDPWHFPAEFDVISSISVFYDLDDPNKFVSGVASILAKQGVWVIQQNYLAETIRLNAIDNFCHEHLTYFSLASLDPLLERHGLEVVEASVVPVNGGSIRTVVAHKGSHVIRPTVSALREREAETGVDRHETMMAFAHRAKRLVQLLSDLVTMIHESGGDIAIYGASTRGATIWQAAGIAEEVRCAVERNPQKVGKFFSALGIPIISEDEARAEPPDYMLIGPWFYADEIIARDRQMIAEGTRVIIPLPAIEFR